MQILLLPPSLDEMIDKNHPVRIVSQIIDQIDISPLEKQYKGGGTSSYHPRILLKILVYAYLDNVYSSRRIEACLKENIHYMWISGMSSMDHNTINRFRGERLKGARRSRAAPGSVAVRQRGPPGREGIKKEDALLGRPLPE